MQVIHERCAALDGHKKDSGDDHHDHPSRRIVSGWRTRLAPQLTQGQLDPTSAGTRTTRLDALLQNAGAGTSGRASIGHRKCWRRPL